ncbi:metal-dependent transcriptional regulator [Stratiformator vulcanicus]|uniref:Transcriptional regulator MntR n=1 Tax=Stratiformator vulcanicus TaxID=2527980 RepID=A0A517QZ46_9PLAN|nr:metal-dependent transcriptional regulator [Stratiformator vulcanicus]QDT36925.1 Iron-dependent repressor IdeR [Stratiformator vulcanicus]
MPSLTVENYLKSILQVGLRTDHQVVSTGRLAEELGVSPGTVTSMLKTLSDAELAAYTPYEGVELTEKGRTHAIKVLRRHRLIELFLVKTLNLTWDQVHEEAEHMEHAVSDQLIDAIDEFLGSPTTDPHGDPIPTSQGEMPTDQIDTCRLCDCKTGTNFRLVRVTNQSADFLRFLSDSGMEIGVSGTISGNSTEAALVTVDVDGKSISLGHAAAEGLLVEER